MRGLSCLVGIALAASACTGGGASSDGSVDSIIEVSIEWPVGCPPATSNEKGIGKACTRGGNQCGAALSTLRVSTEGS